MNRERKIAIKQQNLIDLNQNWTAKKLFKLFNLVRQKKIFKIKRNIYNN